MRRSNLFFNQETALHKPLAVKGQPLVARRYDRD